MKGKRIVIIGGGAAGLFAAIACAKVQPNSEITVLEKGENILGKVRISGGGRCNLTHACFDPRELASRYPRGGRALLGAFTRFQPRNTMAWFESHGVSLKIEDDGRVFPESNTARTIIDCLVNAARDSEVVVRTSCGVDEVSLRPQDGFSLILASGERMECDQLLVATGGCRSAAMGHIAVFLGHSLAPPVPSLFTFNIKSGWVRDSAGISLAHVELWVPALQLRESGPVVFTHWGLSGPAILRLSSWGARVFHDANYHFPLRINWLPGEKVDDLKRRFEQSRKDHPTRHIVTTPVPSLPARLWEKLIDLAQIPRDLRWAEFSRRHREGLLEMLLQTTLEVSGKSPNKDEFVTCGGVRLDEVDFKTMESRIHSGLFFAGELLDIDGPTGGYNLQAAWTTGWIAGHGMAGEQP